MDDVEDPEDILSSSLQTLYDYAPITHSTPGALFTYTYAPQSPAVSSPSTSRTISLSTPDPAAQNWALHASAIWLSALYIADHLTDLRIPPAPPLYPSTTADEDAVDAEPAGCVRVLELGAAAGLPSILIAQMHAHARVTASDYPDAQIAQTLRDNVQRNGVTARVRVVPHAWGDDPAPLLAAPAAPPRAFEVVVAADTLWDPALHARLLDTLTCVLAHTRTARAHFVAGLHTGRYTISAFVRAAEERGLGVESAEEREVGGEGRRPWMVEREGAEGETEKERRRWIVWIVLRWQGAEG
ncbi:hypothetical protein FA95DRAFT_1127041 [Auriscalpium vulgare]|uniref:Uncharacterized protein n=1 Tax=Auriscalpium vulgare TaxID=40419 RepID=A0ACB8RV54_9AGAM|nr:hypothetical protein FA95DRAFT_1127041 [Auriscalpium vulgare]